MKKVLEVGKWMLIGLAGSVTYTAFGFGGVLVMTLVFLLASLYYIHLAKVEQAERIRKLKEEYSKGR